MEYILFTQNNTDTVTTEDQWSLFFTEANNCSIFQGSIEISNQLQIGAKFVPKITNIIADYVRFESEDKILALFEKHPVVIQGGTFELCEMPKS